jgi:hypothetical protein
VARFSSKISDTRPPMADSNELEIDPSALPPESGSKPPVSDAKSRETVRIQLAPRQPSDELPPRPLTGPWADSKPAAQVLTSPEVSSPPPAPLPLSTELSSAPEIPDLVATVPGAPSSSPKKETARIPRMPDLPSKPLPTVQMKKTQPLIAMPHAAPKRASIAVMPAEKSAMPLYWVLLGVSAIILIIQIWTYFS